MKLICRNHIVLDSGLVGPIAGERTLRQRRLAIPNQQLKLAVCLAVVSTAGGCIGQADDEVQPVYPTAETVLAATGNGGPSGAHYNLNLIGVTNPKSTSLTGGDGRRIFVPLVGSTKIMLSQGDFAVLDANGTDGAASFRLPNPDPDGDGITQYSVFARALGTPGGSSKTTTCATDPVTGELFCSVFSMVLVRDSGKSSFTNVSKDLLFVFADIDGDGDLERVSLFDSALTDFFWQYDNTGLKLAQLRFYQVPTNVN